METVKGVDSPVAQLQRKRKRSVLQCKCTQWGGVGWGGELVGGSVQWMKTTQHVLYVAAAKAVVRMGPACGGRGESLRVFADIRTRRSVTWIRDPSSVLS